MEDRIMKICEKQNKKHYKDGLSAQIALFNIMINDNKKHKEIRYYFCKNCHGYHLTSQIKKG